MKAGSAPCAIELCAKRAATITTRAASEAPSHFDELIRFFVTRFRGLEERDLLDLLEFRLLVARAILTHSPRGFARRRAGLGF